MKNTKAIHVFDLDRTLIVSNCSVSFCKYLVSRKIVASSLLAHCAIYYFRHIFLNMSLSDLHAHVFDCFLKGRSLASLEQEVDGFIRSHLERALYMPALCELKRAQHLGYYTLILSSSPNFLVKKIAQFLGVANCRGTEYGIDKDQKLCDIASIMQGEEKAHCVLKIADELGVLPSEITAYSDSMWDLPLLLASGTPIAVHPDRKLRAYSLKAKWKII